jgi:hypothetical protein
MRTRGGSSCCWSRLILYLGLFIYPTVRAFGCCNWTGFAAKMEWVGLANFATVEGRPLLAQPADHAKIIFLGGAAVLAFLFTFFLTSGSGKKICQPSSSTRVVAPSRWPPSGASSTTVSAC